MMNVSHAVCLKPVWDRCCASPNEDAQWSPKAFAMLATLSRRPAKQGYCTSRGLQITTHFIIQISFAAEAAGIKMYYYQVLISYFLQRFTSRCLLHIFILYGAGRSLN